MSLQEEIIVRELEKNPNIRITELELLTDLSIGEVCKIRYFWKLERKREARRFAACHGRKEGKSNFKLSPG